LVSWQIALWVWWLQSARSWARLALMGSNKRTQDETLAALKEHEARRSAIIEGIEMKMLSSLTPEGVGKH